MGVYLHCDSNAKMKYSFGFALETPEGKRKNNNRIGTVLPILNAWQLSSDSPHSKWERVSIMLVPETLVLFPLLVMRSGRRNYSIK